MAKTFKVIIRDTENTIFDGQVTRISSYNEVGAFDVYPMHANFISILRQEVTLYKDHEKVKEMQFEQAVLKVKADTAHIFLGIEVLFLAEV
ncbi:MAG: hypothetical protein E6P95_00470 [Candidatus Moraniibacteriota bacterium]|nr:MAG: hypothetical protein E6P95_00470 [Candidatus Moranbacteria bacterium]